MAQYVRWMLTSILTAGIWYEAGWFTAISYFLISLAFLEVSYQLRQLNARLDK